MGDNSVADMCWIITNVEDDGRLRDAAQTLLGILPALDCDEVDKVIRDMSWVLTNREHRVSRSAASMVLIAFKNAKGMR